MTALIPNISIGGRRIGPGNPCLVIAEIAQAHDGSLGAAHAYIDAAANAGADAIKFQTHIASAESTPSEPWRIYFSRQDASRYEYWRRMEFSESQWNGLAAHAAERGLIFLSSPFSAEAVALLDRTGVPAWKVASGEVSNLPLLKQMASTGKPLLLSSGMSAWAEIDAAVACARQHRADVAIFQCTSAYPCPPERLGLNLVQEIASRYGCPAGLSDHSGTIFAGLAAVARGANLVEVHIVFSRECFGPDTPVSLVPSELRQLVDGVRFIERALAHPVDKEDAARDLIEVRQLFSKSVVAIRALSKGTRLERTDLALKKPGTGIPAVQIDEVVGRTLAKAVIADQVLTDEDLV